MFNYGKAKSALHRWVSRGEAAVKVSMFDCSMCGQCMVRTLGFTCPMRCPKQMRNGPCGGSMYGKCEVFPDRPCVWHLAWKRTERLGWTDKLEEIQPPVDWRLWGTSSWLNLATGTIDTHGHVNEAKVEMPDEPGVRR